MHWWNLDRFPAAAGDGWQARRIGGPTLRDKAAIDAAVAKWQPFVPLLVRAPGSSRFLPVTCVEEYRAGAHRSVMRAQIRTALILVLLAGLLGLFRYAGAPHAVRASLMALFLSGFAALDYLLVSRRLDALTERALLALWVAEKGRVYACAWAGVMLVAGISQIYGESLAGGRDALVLGVGVVHRLVLQGELWRLVVGPFLHASFLHWLGNFVMLTFVGAIAGALLGRASALVFLLGSSCGALAGTACSVFTHADAYVGVSAGIFALMGWCAGAAFRRPCLFPIAFRWTASCFALLSVAAAWLTNPNASNIGHVAGALFGLLGGAAFPPQAVSRGKPGA